MQGQNRKFRRIDGQNKISKRQRCIRLSMLNILETKMLLECFGNLNSLMFMQSSLLTYCENLEQCTDDIWEMIYLNLTYPDDGTIVSAVRPPNTLIPSCQTLDKAMHSCGTVRQFEQTFGVNPQEVLRLRTIVFRNIEFLEVDARLKKGKIATIEAMLLILARLKNSYANEENLGFIMQRDESFISVFTRQAVRVILRLHSHLLDVSNFPKFRPFFAQWRQTVLDKYVTYEGEVQSLPWIYSGTTLFMDGVRVEICRPREHQELFYSGYTGNHNFTNLVITSPDGIFLCCPPADIGLHTDQFMSNKYQISQLLTNNDVKVLADKGFTSSALPNSLGGIAALPKVTTPHPMFQSQLKALAAVRTAGAEWPFGQLEMAFHYINRSVKQKLFQTCPMSWFRCSMLLSNLIRLMRGCNGTTWFSLLPVLSPEDYFAM
jgi:hypothetical protein